MISSLLFFLIFFFSTQSLRFSFDDSECFIEEGVKDHKILFYYKTLGGPSTKVRVSIVSSTGTQLYRRTAEEDVIDIYPAKNESYTFCFYRDFDLDSLSNEVSFDIQNEKNIVNEDPNLSAAEKNILDVLLQTQELVSKFSMKLSMNSGDLSNDMLVVTELHNKVLRWSVLQTIVIIILTITQVLLIRRLFIDN